MANTVNGAHGPDCVEVHFLQFSFRHLMLKMHLAEKITETIEVDQELKIDHKTALSSLHDAGLKKSSDFGCHTN